MEDNDIYENACANVLIGLNATAVLRRFIPHLYHHLSLRHSGATLLYLTCSDSSSSLHIRNLIHHGHEEGISLPKCSAVVLDNNELFDNKLANCRYTEEIAVPPFPSEDDEDDEEEDNDDDENDEEEGDN